MIEAYDRGCHSVDEANSQRITSAAMWLPARQMQAFQLTSPDALPRLHPGRAHSRRTPFPTKIQARCRQTL